MPLPTVLIFDRTVLQLQASRTYLASDSVLSNNIFKYRFLSCLWTTMVLYLLQKASLNTMYTLIQAVWRATQFYVAVTNVWRLWPRAKQFPKIVVKFSLVTNAVTEYMEPYSCTQMSIALRFLLFQAGVWLNSGSIYTSNSFDFSSLPLSLSGRGIKHAEVLSKEYSSNQQGTDCTVLMEVNFDAWRFTATPPQPSLPFPIVILALPRNIQTVRHD